MYDLIIIGAGPAGITASIYASRKKMNFIVISKDVGGQAAWSSEIQNYTGFQLIKGYELTQKFEEHMKQYNVPLSENEEVIKVVKEESAFIVRTTKKEYEAKTVIIASGKKSKELGVPGEIEFKNRGVAYCATCDGPLFAGKDVAVIGGGNSALDAAIGLVKIAKKVYVVNIAEKLSGDSVMSEKLKISRNVEIFNNSRVTKITGDKMVSGIVLNRDSNQTTLPVSGVFVEIGLTPNSEFIEITKKNENGEIQIDCSSRTSVPGIFAAGDVTDVPAKQIIISAGDGAKAALGAFNYINKMR